MDPLYEPNPDLLSYRAERLDPSQLIVTIQTIWLEGGFQPPEPVLLYHELPNRTIVGPYLVIQSGPVLEVLGNDGQVYATVTTMCRRRDQLVLCDGPLRPIYCNLDTDRAYFAQNNLVPVLYEAMTWS